MNASLSKITTPLIGRVVIFLGLFVLISGVNGPRIIGGDIMFRDGFAFYGSLGKAAIFGLIALVLLVRHKGFRVGLKPWRVQQLGWLAASAGLTTVAWISVSRLLADERTAANLILAHGGLLLGAATAGLACFGLGNLALLWRTYKGEILQAGVIAAAFYLFLLGVYALWRPLAAMVLASVHVLFGFTSVPTEVVPPNVLITDKFGITVAEFCSGIESIALFTGLYVIVGLLDRQRLRLGRYLLVFPCALVVLFGLNILRVFGLIAAGYYIDQQIAFSLFHSYAGMIFFILYSVAFWGVAYKYLVSQGADGARQPSKTSQKNNVSTNVTKGSS